MISRRLAAILRQSIQKYPVVAVVGPRQSGKTTLTRSCFPDFRYLSLEETDLASQGRSDPRGFFQRFSGDLILDEVQKTPDLLSFIQSIVDTPGNSRRFVLSGSENLHLSEKISQTLAGRVRNHFLLPLTRREFALENLSETLLMGGYPRIHDQALEATSWLADYYATYVQRDVRSVLNVTDLNQFDRFVRVAASRVGQLLDYTNLGAAVGVSQPTAKAWLSVLANTFICFTLEPHFKNFGKRLIKSPKLYFYDSGLLCYLLRIKSVDQLLSHPLYGSIFENWVIGERLKQILHDGKESDLYFWRDQKGHEVDIVADRAGALASTEIKSSVTFHESFLENIRFLNSLQQGTASSTDSSGECVYGGEETFTFKECRVVSWRDV